MSAAVFLPTPIIAVFDHKGGVGNAGSGGEANDEALTDELARGNFFH